VTAPTIRFMDDQRRPSGKRIRLTGERFKAGRLPVDSLIELERYQEVVRKLAEYEWRRDHPDEQLPADFRALVSLTIERIDEGSADVLLAFEQHAVYVQYQDEAQDAVDATIAAAYAGAPLPPLPALPPAAVAEFREELADFGATLREAQSIEFYVNPDDTTPVLITVETRKQALTELILTDFMIAPSDPVGSADIIERREESLIGRVTAVDADSTKYEIATAYGKVHGWYKENTGVLEDLRSVLNSAEEGPLTRITGELRFKNGDPHRFWQTTRVERVEFEDTAWGARLTDFAQLPTGWAEGTGAQISFVSLDAAQQLLKAVEAAGNPLPAVFPTAEGGVLIEWATTSGIHSVEILEDGLFELFSLQRAQGEGVHSETRDISEAIRFATAARA